MQAMNVEDEIAIPIMADPASFTRLRPGGTTWEDRQHRYYISRDAETTLIFRQGGNSAWGTTSNERWDQIERFWLDWYSVISYAEKCERDMIFLAKHAII